MPQLDGIDVSHYQDADDGATKELTLTGPLQQLPLGCAKASEGASFQDPTFPGWWGAFKAAGYRYRGAYHFLRANVAADVQFANFKTVIDSVGGLKLGDFVMLDWERAGDETFPSIQCVFDFLTLCRRQWPGRCVVYSATWVQGWSTWFNQASREPLWWPNYSKAIRAGLSENDAHSAHDDHPFYDATVVQWSSTEQVAGIDGNVDANQITFLPTLEALCGYTAANVPADPDRPTIEHTDTLARPNALRPWDVLVSGNGIWTARMQADGNLVVLCYTKPVWSSATAGNPGAELQLGDDGNLLLCLPSKPLWTSWTPAMGALRLVMQNDGNLVLYAAGKAVWSTWTGIIK